MWRRAARPARLSAWHGMVAAAVVSAGVCLPASPATAQFARTEPTDPKICARADKTLVTALAAGRENVVTLGVAFFGMVECPAPRESCARLEATLTTLITGQTENFKVLGALGTFQGLRCDPLTLLDMIERQAH